MAKLKDLKVTIGLEKKGLRKLNQDLRTTKHKFRANFGEIASMAKNAAAVIATTLVAGVALLIKKGAEMETLRTGFISIAGGANKAAAIVKELNDFTAKTPFQLQEVSSAARQLLAVGTERSELQKELKMLGDIAASSGNSINDIAAIFAKVQAKGKVELENLNQLAERGIPIFDELRSVTGDANMEFGAGAVSVEQFNDALANMTAEGGLAAGAMENLSETVEGRMTTLMDNLGLELGKAAEKSGLSAAFGGMLKEATTNLQGISGAAGSDVMAALGLAEEAMEGFGSVTTDNLDDVEQKMADAKASMASLVDEIRGSATKTTGLALLFGGKAGAMESAKQQADMLRPLLEMIETIDDAAVELNQNVLSGGVVTGGGAGAGAGGGGDDGDREARLKAFTERFNAAAALTEQQKALAEATAQQIVTDEGLIEAQQGLRDAYGQVGGAIVEVTMAEEELFDEEAQERIVEGERMLRNAALAAANIGAAMSVTSALTNAAFDSIKEGGKSFGESVLAMLESLLKKAIALAAAFAAMSLIGGPTAVKALGSFKSFMMGGMGIQGFADGGLVTGATLAMVGEGPGTSLSNPEVIAPLDKLQSMMGGGNVNVTGRLDGRDILISSERSNIDRNRIRGF